MLGKDYDNKHCSFLSALKKEKHMDEALVKVTLPRSKSAYYWSTCFNHTQQNERKQRKIILKNRSCAVTLTPICSEHTQKDNNKLV